MDAAAGRSGSLPVPSSHPPPRKEWRAISEHSFRKNGGEEPESLKLVQTDERTIYEVQEGTGPVNINFSSITVNGESLKEDILQRRIQEISRQREDLQHMEIELRAQVIARSEILEMHDTYQSQLKEHIDATAKLKEQLQEREQEVRELELNLEEKNRELHAVKIDNEAVWAKEDLFREQNKELATFRKERDNSESERGQLLKKIHDFKEHIQDKESQFLALEEQHRVAQETILYKDEQLREVQAWLARVQEVDALQSTTNRSLQAELHERTEQFNQYWIVLQQQFVEMERHHLQTIQQLHLELAELRSGVYQDSSQVVRENQTDSSLYLLNKDNQVNANEGLVLNSGLTFGSDGKLPASSSSTNAEHVPILPSVLGMGAFAPVGQMTALHPFVMHQQGVPESISSANPIIPQSHASHLQPMSVIPAQHWQEQQVVQEVSQTPNQDKYHLSQLEHNLLRSHSQYSHELSATGNVLHPEYLSSPMNQQLRSAPETTVSNDQIKVPESIGKTHQVSQERQAISNMNSKLTAPVFEQTVQQSEHKVLDQNGNLGINGPHEQVLDLSKQWSDSNVVSSGALSHGVDTNGAEECNEDNLVFPEPSVPVIGTLGSMPTNKTKDPFLLDERALLACIVRAIPAGSDGRIRISTTLPNRLGKMLAPLHWHDYKKHYGKLDDFVSRHPELFVIEGDYIHLCDGAQEIISATAAMAKVAAAAASSAPYSSLLPSVAVTPISQNNRNKKSLSFDSKPVNSASFLKDASVNNTGNLSDKYTQIPKAQAQQQNGVNINVVQGLADIALSSRKNYGENSDVASNTPPDLLTLSHFTGNGSNNALTNGRVSFGGKKPGRASGVRVISRR